MRTFTAAVIAAFFAAGTVAAYAETAAKTAPKCKGMVEADCKANTACKWTAGTGSAAGKCTKAKKSAPVSK
jgi:hypothetical protein